MSDAETRKKRAFSRSLTPVLEKRRQGRQNTQKHSEGTKRNRKGKERDAGERNSSEVGPPYERQGSAGSHIKVSLKAAQYITPVGGCSCFSQKQKGMNWTPMSRKILGIGLEAKTSTSILV